jgi:sigma-B regulation protein RsbU (phosphoserine phosphatase)
MDPARLAGLGEGFWKRERGEETFLVRVSGDAGRRVVVAESTREVRERVRANLKRQAGWFLGAGVLLLGAVNLTMRRAVLRPIRRIGRAVRQLEEGQLGVEVEDPGDDELGSLARRFNAMSRTLADQAEADRREMETARRVQAHLLPSPDLRLGCVQVAGRSLPAGPVGGDIYDVQLLPGDRIGLLVVDLSGHNVAAALHTAMVRAIAWREAEQAESPGEVMARLNERLCQDFPDEHFATGFFGWFDPSSHQLRYASAGHPPALLQSPAGPLRELGPTMPLLGVVPGLPAADAAVEVEPESRLLLFTDGLTEVTDPHSNLWGTGELGTLLRDERSADPGGLVARILERSIEFRRSALQQDDVTIVLAVYDPVRVTSPLSPDGASESGSCSHQSCVRKTSP